MLTLKTKARWPVECLAFAPDGGRLAAGGSAGVRLFDLFLGREVIRYGGHTAKVLALTFAPDGETVISTDDIGKTKVWEVDAGLERGDYSFGPGVRCVDLSPDGSMLVGGGSWWFSWVRVYYMEVATGRTRAGPSGGDFVLSVRFSPDGKTLATGGRDGRIRLWDVTTGHERAGFAARLGQLLHSLAFGRSAAEERDVLKYKNQIRSLKFSPDGKLIAAATGWRTTLWELGTGRLLTTLRGHGKFVSDIAFSPDGSTLASAGLDGVVKFWSVADIAAGRRRRHQPRATFAWGLRRAHALTFSPDGTRVAVGGDNGQIIVWDFE